MNNPDRNGLTRVLSDVRLFSKLHTGFELRDYQVAPARAVVDAIRSRSGDQLCIVFSRQAGKDEMLAQLLAYLLTLYSQRGGSIVVAAPTQMPQAQVSRDRLYDRLMMNPLTKPLTRREGFVVHVGRARVTFVGAHSTSARGQTASLLLVANEAQDIPPDQWDAVFDPMGASTNAPNLFMGTVWTDSTLLARQMAHARDLEAQDARRRLYLVPWEAVAVEVPAYGARVRSRIAQLGDNHPFIRTEYKLLELSGDGGLFTAQRQALMQGTHARRHEPMAGELVAFLVDVAGEDEQALEGPGLDRDPDARRDSTVLTVVSIATSANHPARYSVLDRFTWNGTRWDDIQGAMMSLLRKWKPVATVVDATGIGFGMYTALRRVKGQRVEPFTFSSKSKSELGWQLVALIDAGRLDHYAHDGRDDTVEFWRQVGHTTYSIRPGEARLMQWSVPTSDGHDDSVLSLALVAELDRLDVSPRIARGR